MLRLTKSGTHAARVIATSFVDGGDVGVRAHARLRGERLVAPHLLDVEVISAWRRQAAAGELDERRVALAVTDLGDLRVRRVPHGALLDRCWALRANVTPYDAVDVALAQRLDAVLLTAAAADRLAAAPIVRCEVELLT